MKQVPINLIKSTKQPVITKPQYLLADMPA